MKQTKKNIAASVHRRLLNEAKKIWNCLSEKLEATRTLEIRIINLP
jgi:hypothetical protein